ncbi:MAG: nucleotidyltransferase domain-containing protein [Anaerolineae bacterium]
MKSSPIDLELLFPQLKSLFENYKVDLAYLFGSQARGEAGPLSDVDVAVQFAATTTEEEVNDYRLRLMVDLQSVFGRNDVQVVDLASASPLLRHRVYRDGKLLYARDDRIRVAFLEQALRDYVDTKPLRRIQAHYLHKSIRAGTFGRPKHLRKLGSLDNG